MKNKLSDLRNHLFETLEALKDEEKPMDVARARAISEVAAQLIDTARVEVEFLKATDAVVSDSTFFEDVPKTLELEDQRRRRLA